MNAAYRPDDRLQHVINELQDSWHHAHRASTRGDGPSAVTNELRWSASEPSGPELAVEEPPSQSHSPTGSWDRYVVLVLNGAQGIGDAQGPFDGLIATLTADELRRKYLPRATVTSR